jgi:hypothetical protein
MRNDERKILQSIDESLGCLAWTGLGILLVLCTMCARL